MKGNINILEKNTTTNDKLDRYINSKTDISKNKENGIKGEKLPSAHIHFFST